MDQEHVTGGGHRGQPPADLFPVAVAGEGIDPPDGGPHSHVAAMDLEELRPFDKRPAAGSDGLEAGHEDGRPRVGQPAGEMMEDPPAVHHTAGGDDDPGPFVGVDRLRFLRCPRHPHPGRRHRVGHPLHPRLGEVMLLDVPPEHLGGLDRHRRIDPHRDFREPAGRHERAEKIDQLLATADGERRHEHHAAALDRLLRDGLELVERSAGGVVTVAIGALAHEDIARRRGHRIVVERGIVAADVPGEHEPQRPTGGGTLHLHERTSEHVAGVVEPGPDPLGRREPGLAVERFHQTQRPFDVALIVEGEGGSVFRVALPIGVDRILRLALGRVVEEEAEEIGCGAGGEDRSAEAVARQSGQPAGVVDVAVGEDDRVDRVGGHRELGPVPLP